MEDIIIKKGESEHNGWFVEQEDKVSCECGWDEMMGLVAALTMPEDRLCLSWMEPKNTHKEGDFVYLETKSSCRYIFIKKDNGFISGGYAFLSLNEEIVYVNDGYDRIADNSDVKIIRPATEEEKRLLLSKLHENGKEWDAEKKEVVDWQWKSQLGEVYYSPELYSGSFFDTYEREWNNTVNDNKILEKG